jgi:type II secretory ATPase GspE/PulE/Tfp pilus assembly ATPase PilB-like protein
MVVGEDIQQAISEGVGIARMTELAVRSGMVPLDEAIAIVIRDGESSLTELARVATTHD